MRYMSSAPYRILANSTADFHTVQRVVRFARYWDLVGNSGRFPSSLPVIPGENPFENFMRLSDWLFSTTTQTHRIALPRLFELLWQYMTEKQDVETATASATLHLDFKHNRLKGTPAFIVPGTEPARPKESSNAIRQTRHSACVDDVIIG